MKKRISLFLIIIISVGCAYYFWPAKPLDSSKNIDKILILKSKRQLIVYSGEEALKIYPISLGRNPNGKKEFEGDKKTPEGIYNVFDKNPNSSYHLNLGISYPSISDTEYAKNFGKSPGGLIKIHGMRNGFGFIGKFHRFFDWTLGCIAVTNGEIEELYEYIPVGTTIEIRP